MKRVLVISALLMASVVGVLSMPGDVRAESGSGSGSSGGASATVPKACPTNSMRDTYVHSIAECSLPKESPTTGDKTLPQVIQTIVNVVLSVVGVIAVVMIILGGISFITSQGDAAKVTKARNTLLYGIVGLVIALLAFAIVNFVLSSVFKSEEASTTPSPSVYLNTEILK